MGVEMEEGICIRVGDELGLRTQTFVNPDIEFYVVCQWDDEKSYSMSRWIDRKARAGSIEEWRSKVDNEP